MCTARGQCCPELRATDHAIEMQTVGWQFYWCGLCHPVIYVSFPFESVVSAHLALYLMAFMLILGTKGAIVAHVMPHFAGTKRCSCCNDKSEEVQKRMKAAHPSALTAWLIKRCTDQRGSIKIGPGSPSFFMSSLGHLKRLICHERQSVSHDGCQSDVWESTYLSGHTLLYSELSLFKMPFSWWQRIVCRLILETEL